MQGDVRLPKKKKRANARFFSSTNLVHQNFMFCVQYASTCFTSASGSGT